jgi:hypothetical protein
MNAAFEYNGFRIYESKGFQKVQIRHDFEWITDDVRKSVNDWLAATFGFDAIIEDGQAIIDERNRTIHMNPRTFFEARKLMIPTNTRPTN